MYVNGTSGDDTLKGTSTEDTILGRGGNDHLHGRGGADLLKGGPGDLDQVHGGAGADTVIGGVGNDLLWGDGGADRLRGGDGADILTGGAGQDTLKGGVGSDVFTFTGSEFGAPRSGRDLVLDFEDGADLLEFHSFGGDYNEEQEILAAAEQAGSDTVIRIEGQAVIRLRDFDVSDLDENDITFGGTIADFI